MEDLKFEWESINALNIMENTNKNLYLTWKAWAWKSTLVNFFISKTKKKFILLWTTWIAAINIGWQTIHSFFNLIPWQRTNIKQATKEIVKDTDIFIIDEVSMMRADLFDKINTIMKMIMWNDEFLWWKQFVFVWDLLQLPPVPERDEELKKYYNEKYKWLFFFDWNSFIREKFEVIELKKVYRQEDPKFINMLNRLRIWDKSQDLLDYFNNRVVEKDQINPKSIVVATTNYIVNTKNNLELAKLPWNTEFSKAIVKWEYPKEDFPTEELIKMKVWARIMFTTNENLTFAFANWTLWTITKINKNSSWFITTVEVTLDEWITIEVNKKTWQKTDWEDEFWEPIITWTFTQFPFKLAFAITIHKSQWKSFDNVVIDLWTWAFVDWQVYVAISRCRSYEWLQLLQPIRKKDISISTHVLRFLKTQND